MGQLPKPLAASGAVSMRSKNFSRATPLFTIRDPVIVEYLLGLGVDPTAIDRTGGTALHEADDPTSIQLLIEAGADPNARDDEGYTPFLITMYDPESIEVARALLDAGADPYISNIYGMTALHLAESAELIRLVVNHADDSAHVDIEATNNGGLTPLHLAAFWNRADVIEELLLMGASPTAVTHDGETPFDLVSQGCDSGLVLDCMLGTKIYWRLNDLRFE
jgi:ankyrin repeat protein